MIVNLRYLRYLQASDYHNSTIQVMMKQIWVLLVFLSVITLPTQSQNSTNTTTCPLDFGYVLRVPYKFSSCKNFKFPPKSPLTDTTSIPCCHNLLSLFGIGLAQRLKETSLFLLPNISTSVTCLQSYQSKITNLSLHSDLVSYCFEPIRFVISPNICVGIETSKDMEAKLNQTARLASANSACRPDLTNISNCDACVKAGPGLLDKLVNKNLTTYQVRNCWSFAIIYTAAMINEFGPESNGSVSCLFGLSMDSHIGSPKKKITIVVVVVLSPIGGLLTILISYLLWKKYFEKGREHRNSKRNFNAGDEENDPELPLFSLKSMIVATNNFSVANKLGEGGFGPVYKGILPKYEEVAMKRLSKKSGQGHLEFMNELKLITKLQHTNLVRIFGCCIEDEEMILIYEYMHNRSLDKFLFDSSDHTILDWGTRFRIIEGIAQGVLYIHKYSRLKIIHRDLKASNVLLDEEMNPKISDFGMAKIFEKDQTEANTNKVVGTYGYMSPEYARYGHFSEKSDIFSFGVLLLEIVSGKRNAAFYHSKHTLTLAGWAWRLWREGKGIDVVDVSVRGTCGPHEALRCIHVAFLCVQEDPADRPTMSLVIQMLQANEATSLPAFKEPAFSLHGNPSVVGSSSSSPSPCVFSENALTVTILEGR